MRKSCFQKGLLRNLEERDVKRMGALFEIALGDIEQASKLVPLTPTKSRGWTTIYKLHYDALHELADAFLCFDRVRSENHQCLFAALCEMHPEFEFSWEFFEKVRSTRNGMQYDGKPVDYFGWKAVDVQFELCIKTLKIAIEIKLIAKDINY